jgi:hypothetical protein
VRANIGLFSVSFDEYVDFISVALPIQRKATNYIHNLRREIKIIASVLLLKLYFKTITLK